MEHAGIPLLLSAIDLQRMDHGPDDCRVVQPPMDIHTTCWAYISMYMYVCMYYVHFNPVIMMIIEAIHTAQCKLVQSASYHVYATSGSLTGVPVDLRSRIEGLSSRLTTYSKNM